MKNITCSLASVFMALSFCNEAFSENNFQIKSSIPGMKDGIVVSVISNETGSGDVIANDTVKNGSFLLTGSVEHPVKCTLITNNLGILSEEETVPGKIRWTYTDFFLDNTEMIFEASHYDSIAISEPIGLNFRITGGTIQDDFNRYNNLLFNAKKDAADNYLSEEKFNKFNLDFIKSNPGSVVSLKLANDMLIGAYQLNYQTLINIKKNLGEVEGDKIRYEEFIKNFDAAIKTAVNSPVNNLPLIDTEGNDRDLINVIPKDKYVIVDFWASWCGICIANVPAIIEIMESNKDKIEVIGISADDKDDAWKKSMLKEKMPWQQYRLSKQGLKDFREKYLVLGVPYYLLVNTDGTVISSAKSPSDIRLLINEFCK